MRLGPIIYYCVRRSAANARCGFYPSYILPYPSRMLGSGQGRTFYIMGRAAVSTLDSPNSVAGLWLATLLN